MPGLRSYRSDDAPLWYTPEGDIHAMLAFSDTIFSVGCGREPQPVMVMDFGGRSIRRPTMVYATSVTMT